MYKSYARCLLLTGALLAIAGARGETVRVTAITAPGTPWYESWEYFERRLNSEPTLSLEAKFYLLGQLGSEESALSQLRRGRVQMGGFSLQGASAVVPELGVLMTPYLFSSFEEVDYVMDRYLLDAFDELFANKGLVLLAWAEVGWTHLYSTGPIATPSAARGLKLRSSNALASQLLIRSVGADAVPMAFPDIMPSLQTGLIQGGESGAILYALAGLPAEAPWLILTRHAFDSGMYLANREWFEGLGKSRQKQLRDSLMSTQQFRRKIRAVATNILANPPQHGFELYVPDPSQLQAWREATGANGSALVSAIGGESASILDLVTEGKHAFRRQASEQEQGEPRQESHQQ